MSSKNKRRFCMDCGIDTFKIAEHYMLIDKVWNRIHNSNVGMLCIQCAESRLGRILVPEDFKECFLNNRLFGERSVRLSERLGFLNKPVAANCA